MKILRILMPCSIQLTSLTTWEGASWRSNPKLILCLLDWILLHIRLRRYGILYPPIIKRHLLFPILSSIYWNGQDLTANVDAVLYVVHMMFDLYVLKLFYLFYKCFYRLLVNCYGFFFLHPMCVLMSYSIFACIILTDHFSFRRLIYLG